MYKYTYKYVYIYLFFKILFQKLFNIIYLRMYKSTDKYKEYFIDISISSNIQKAVYYWIPLKDHTANDKHTY